MLWSSSIKQTPTFKGGTFISDAMVQCYLYYTALLNKAWTCALSVSRNFWWGLKPFNLFRILEYEHCKQFARIYTSSLIKTEKILNSPITKFYNSGDVNVIAAELRLTKRRTTSLYNRKSFVRNNANRCK